MGTDIGEEGSPVEYTVYFGPEQGGHWDDDCGTPITGSACSMNTVSGSRVRLKVKDKKNPCDTFFFDVVWTIDVTRTTP